MKMQEENEVSDRWLQGPCAEPWHTCWGGGGGGIGGGSVCEHCASGKAGDRTPADDTSGEAIKSQIMEASPGSELRNTLHAEVPQSALGLAGRELKPSRFTRKRLTLPQRIPGRKTGQVIWQTRTDYSQGSPQRPLHHWEGRAGHKQPQETGRSEPWLLSWLSLCAPLGPGSSPSDLP